MTRVDDYKFNASDVLLFHFNETKATCHAQLFHSRGRDRQGLNFGGPKTGRA